MNPSTQLQPELEDGLHRLGLDAATLSAPLLAYLALLDRWNRSYNLSAIRAPRDMLVKHVFDALAMHRHVGSGRLADIGSGAGVPGVPLAIALPGLGVGLVESAGKKARFLREVQRRLALPNVEVFHARAEALGPGGYDCLTARALGTLGALVTLAGHLLEPGGRVLAMKGAVPEGEIAALPPGWTVAAVHRLEVPGLAAQRHLVVVERESGSGAAGAARRSG